MAFLGGLFDAFTGDPAKDAAAKNAALYQQYGQQGAGLLGAYGQQAGDILGQYGTAGQGYLTDYAQQAQQALQGGLAPAEAQYAAARGAAQQGIGAYAPLSALGQKYGGATDLYLGALGVGGPQGIAQAQQAFQAGPGYQFQQDEARKALEASAAARGGLLGGNTGTALTQRASDIANQEYGNYLNRLQGFVSPELSAVSGAAGGIAGGYRNLADIYGQQAGLYPTLGTQEAQLLSNLGQARTSLAGNVAGGQVSVLGNVAQGQTNILGNVTGGQAAANQQAAQAAQQGSQNFWNGLLNLGSAGIKGYFGGK